MNNRYHIIGLPRSGTTAIGDMLSCRLRIPQVIEPIATWTNGFHFDVRSDLASENCQDLAERIGRISQCQKYRFGYVEKTPSSVFWAPYFDSILKNRCLVIVVRPIEQVVFSLELKVLAHKDGNRKRGVPGFAHDNWIRLSKIRDMMAIDGAIPAVSELWRLGRWVRINGINGLSNREDIRSYLDHAVRRFAAIRVHSSCTVAVVHYADFLVDPKGIIDALAFFFLGSHPNDGGAFFLSPSLNALRVNERRPKLGEIVTSVVGCAD